MNETLFGGLYRLLAKNQLKELRAELSEMAYADIAEFIDELDDDKLAVKIEAPLLVLKITSDGDVHPLAVWQLHIERGNVVVNSVVKVGLVFVPNTELIVFDHLQTHIGQSALTGIVAVNYTAGTRVAIGHFENRLQGFGHACKRAACHVLVALNEGKSHVGQFAYQSVTIRACIGDYIGVLSVGKMQL